MKRQKLKVFFSKKQRNYHLFVFAVLAFLFLAFETLFSGTVASYADGHIHFIVQLPIVKLICMFIYLSTSVLISAGIRYRMLLIPDIILLVVKLYSTISGIIIFFHHENLISDISAVENIVESLLFSIFLIILICGKTLKKPKKMIRNAPFFCLWALALCFFITIIFETIKFYTAIGLVHQNTLVTIFNFSINILNEFFLILPYILLIFLLFFVPEKTFKAFKNHLLHHEHHE